MTFSSSSSSFSFLNNNNLTSTRTNLKSKELRLAFTKTRQEFKKQQQKKMAKEQDFSESSSSFFSLPQETFPITAPIIPPSRLRFPLPQPNTEDVEDPSKYPKLSCTQKIVYVNGQLMTNPPSHSAFFSIMTKEYNRNTPVIQGSHLFFLDDLPSSQSPSLFVASPPSFLSSSSSSSSSSSTQPTQPQLQHLLIVENIFKEKEEQVSLDLLFRLEISATPRITHVKVDTKQVTNIITYFSPFSTPTHKHFAYFRRSYAPCESLTSAREQIVEKCAKTLVSRCKILADKELVFKFGIEYCLTPEYSSYGGFLDYANRSHHDDWDIVVLYLFGQDRYFALRRPDRPRQYLVNFKHGSMVAMIGKEIFKKYSFSVLTLQSSIPHDERFGTCIFASYFHIIQKTQ